jgi:hypothetical protein
MKTNLFTSMRNFIIIALLSFLFSNVAFSQNTDTLKTVKATPEVAPTTVTPSVPPKSSEDQKKEGKKNEIVVYGGANFTQLSSSNEYESEAGTGYQLGVNYKQGRMFYWQAGARFASSMIKYKPENSPAGTDFGSFSVSDLDFPLTLGVNFTSFMNRVLGVRLFAGAVPAITLKVGDNSYGITKDKVNSFIVYGQGGLGINVAFLVLEVGFNYGFNELLIDHKDSNPGQAFVNLGFRF